MGIYERYNLLSRKKLFRFYFIFLAEILVFQNYWSDKVELFG